MSSTFWTFAWGFSSPAGFAAAVVSFDFSGVGAGDFAGVLVPDFSFCANAKRVMNVTSAMRNDFFMGFSLEKRLNAAKSSRNRPRGDGLSAMEKLNEAAQTSLVSGVNQA